MRPARWICGPPITPGRRRTASRRIWLTGGLIGSPETIRRKPRKFEQSHIDQVILLNQAGRNTHEDICDSLKLFAEDVMPEFHANVPAHDAWKADVLSGRIELAEVDTQAFNDQVGAKSIAV